MEKFNRFSKMKSGQFRSHMHSEAELLEMIDDTKNEELKDDLITVFKVLQKEIDKGKEPIVQEDGLRVFTYSEALLLTILAFGDITESEEDRMVSLFSTLSNEKDKQVFEK